MKTSTLRNTISIVLFAAATGTTGLAQARQTATDTITSTRAPMADASVKIDFNLSAGKLAAALDAFGTQSGIQVNYPPELVAGKQARAVHGRMSWREALGQLLQGSGLSYRQISDTTIVITRSQEIAGFENHPAPVHSTATASPPAPAVTNLSSITVTGTRIPGGTTASPIITIGSEQIQQEGFANLGQVIRSVPQNFSGGQNPGVTSGANISGNNYDTTGGSSLNLRGLGPDATLTLLNDHRMSYGGFVQSVDLSAIPVEAVERLEIVPDGASAIYGSDAVGGVANVILKRDFDGVTVGARYGGATNGGLITREYSATAGTTWATGGLIVAGEKASNDPIYSDQRDYTRSMYRPSTLWQGNDLRSGLLSLHQSVGESVELDLDALGSKRNILTDEAYAGTYYRYTPETKITMVAPSLKVELAGGWTLTLSAALGKDHTSTYQQVIDSDTGAVSSNGGGGAYDNKSRTYQIGAEGRLFALPGGDARLAAGAGYRYNRFVYISTSGTQVYADGDESSRFAYAELNLPLVGPGQGISGVERFVLTGAARTEDGTYGRVTTPKFGLIYSPSADFTLKTSWGKSFKAPTLMQRNWVRGAYLYPPTALGSNAYPTDATVIYLSGGNTDLRPERARTLSASLSFHPEALPGLESELTWFDIDYTARVVQPIVASETFSNPAYPKFVQRDPTDAMQADVLAHSSNFYNLAGVPYDPGKVVAIVDNSYANASRQRIKGIDLSGSYLTDLGEGMLTVRGSASWLDSKQALTTAQNLYDLSGTLFYPARLNGRVGAVWTQGGFAASVFGNYKGGVTDTADGKKGASFTTFDATLSYSTSDGDGLFAGMTFEFAARNLLNRAPPLYAATSPTNAPYDSTNYSAVGRFLSLSLSKHW